MSRRIALSSSCRFGRTCSRVLALNLKRISLRRCDVRCCWSISLCTRSRRRRVSRSARVGAGRYGLALDDARARARDAAPAAKSSQHNTHTARARAEPRRARDAFEEEELPRLLDDLVAPDLRGLLVSDVWCHDDDRAAGAAPRARVGGGGLPLRAVAARWAAQKETPPPGVAFFQRRRTKKNRHVPGWPWRVARRLGDKKNNPQWR